MKLEVTYNGKLRLLVSIFLLMITILLLVPTYAQGELCLPCDCYYPNSNKYGVIENDDCKTYVCCVLEN
jgi:hypothetical protein